MQIEYIIYVRRVDGDNETHEVLDSGTDELRAIVRRAIRDLGVVSSGPGSYPANSWQSDYHDEDREYFERGILKYYTLLLPSLSTHNCARINRLIAAAR